MQINCEAKGTINMKYEEDTVLTLTYGKLKELFYQIQEDGVDSDGGAFPLVYENLDQFIMDKIENEKSIEVCESCYNSTNLDNMNSMYDNEPLITQLRRFKEYILSEDIPEWQQLIAIGGFVIDVIQQLKWSEHKHLYNCNEITDEIIFAVTCYLEEPFHDEINSIWHDWEYNDTGKYTHIQSLLELTDILKDRIKDEYPQISDIIKKFFKIDIDQ